MKFTGQERRAWKRYFIPLQTCSVCAALDAQGRTLTMRIVDISLGGLRVEQPTDGNGHPVSLQPDDSLQFIRCGLKHWGPYVVKARGTVRWSDGGQAGLIFEQTLGLKEPGEK